MNLKKLILPAIAIGAASTLLIPGPATGFSTIAGTLSLSQRDNRVFDNFLDAGANNNTTPDANWPGYTGAELAIWKAASEWASEPHNNNGLGDGAASNPIIGDGGANFDITWQGNANGVGGTNDNIHSGINSCSQGVLAFCETPISNGWRIRYCEQWNWQDGPAGAGGGNAIDIQGVAVHEYGHALGLGHSNVSGATMFPSISGSGVSARSVAADDIAGVQFKYGVAVAGKPHISGISQASGQVIISGNNFSASNNEVWFTQAGTGGTGVPVKVTGVTSNGTSITVVIPAAAGPGDILVRNNGTGFGNLSNQVAIDPNAGPVCPAVITYCTGKTSSVGIPASISHSGTPSFAVNDFAIQCFNGSVGITPGIHFWSNTGQNSAPFGGGILCLQPPTTRGPGHSYDSIGLIDVPIPVQVIDIGQKRWFQFWFRDPSHPDGTGIGLSDAVEVEFCP